MSQGACCHAMARKVEHAGVRARGKKPRKVAHALPLSVARDGNWDAEEVRVAMTALTGNGFQ
jgi:hypothetical protein